jgi:Transcriptional regulatory protein, C terminal
MALKSLSTYRKFCRPQQSPSHLIEVNQKFEAEHPPGRTEGGGGLPVLDDHRRYPPALRAILQLSDHAVAQVSHGDPDSLRGSKVEAISPAAPGVRLSFSWRELVAEVFEFVRDSNSFAEDRIARFGDVCVDFIRMEVNRLSGEVIALTNQEFKTLKCFLSNPGRVFSRDELLNEAWGYENYPSTRTVDNHVLKLRQKLERDPARPIHFRTVHSVGYKFVP